MKKNKVSKLLAIMLATVIAFTSGIAFPRLGQAASSTTNLTIHFDNPENKDWGLWIWPEGLEGADYAFDSEDEFGQVANITLDGLYNRVGFIVKDDGWNKDVGEDRFIDVIGGQAEVWLKSGDPEVYYDDPVSGPKTFTETSLTVHYTRYNPEELQGLKLLAWTNEEGKADGQLLDMTAENEDLVVASVNHQGQEITDVHFQIGRMEDEKFVALEPIATMSRIEDDGTAEVWMTQADATMYPSEETVMQELQITSASMESLNSVKVAFNRVIDANVLKGNVYMNGGELRFQPSELIFESNPTSTITLNFEEDLDILTDYEVSLSMGQDEEEILGKITLGGVVTDPKFDELFAYDGDLGPLYTEDSTEFKVWAPTAKDVNLIVFDGDEETAYGMARQDSGVYTHTLEGDQDGTVYMYDVVFNDKVNRSVDPYAKSVTINGQRSVVVNPQVLESEGPNPEDIGRPIIWELHVRDLSNHPDSGIKHKGQFLGLTEKGTSTSTGQTTGLDYIKSLGVTHVQLLPIYDFGSASIDENDPLGRFNWGYDPVNYNAPEGAYSTDPNDPYARINELQTAIEAIHGQGMGVIMDVVYNHVFSVGEHAFDKIVPGYYFRYDENGNLQNGTGVGNETASERAMVRKFMVDSLSYWTKTYDLDGFRFDLMGIHDVETMNQVYEAVSAINPHIFILGEGWTMGSHTRGAKASDQTNANLVPNIGMFNDHLRDLTKGSVFEATEPGFVNGLEGVEEELISSIKTGPNVADKNYDNPRQFIQYVEAHDNLTLWDKLLATNPDEDQEDILKRHKLATSIALLAQGVPFIHAGQEFARTKDGDHNSYKSSAEVNQLDWERAQSLSDNVEYIRQLIDIRQSDDLFWMESFDEIDQNFTQLAASDKLIGYTLGGQDSTSKFVIGHNASNETKTIEGLDNGTYLVLVKGQVADAKGLELLDVTDGTASIEGLSTLVLKAEETVTETTGENESSQETSGENTQTEEDSTSTFIIAGLVGLAAIAIFLGFKFFNKNK